MARIGKIDPEQAQGELKEVYAGIKRKFGRVPNIFQYMANSPQLLKGFLTLAGLEAQTTLSADVREQIALAVGASNKCNYCLAAHTAASKALGLSPLQVEEAKHGKAPDKKTSAILQFAKLAVEKRGDVSVEEVDALRKEGVSDQEIGDILLAVTVNILTNTFNRVVDTPVDF